MGNDNEEMHPWGYLDFSRASARWVHVSVIVLYLARSCSRLGRRRLLVKATHTQRAWTCMKITFQYVDEHAHTIRHAYISLDALRNFPWNIQMRRFLLSMQGRGAETGRRPGNRRRLRLQDQ